MECYRPIRKMAAANQHKLNFINQRNEPHHKKEHVKISSAAKFRAVGQKAADDRHLKNRRIRDKCMVVGPPKPVYHTFVFYFQVFQVSAISSAFGPEL